MGPTSWSICWQAFQSSLMFVGKATFQEPTRKGILASVTNEFEMPESFYNTGQKN